MVIHGCAAAQVMVSSFGRAQRAALAAGFPKDIDTYLFISGECPHQFPHATEFDIY